MDFKKLFMNNKAVSPVIGVILMVAITVILAAAIGSSVFGQGTAESAPQANLDIQQAGIGAATSYTGNVASIKIEHLGGDTINFASGTKVVASVNDGNSKTLDVSSLTDPLDVGDVQTLKLVTSSSAQLTDTGTTDYISSGDTVNIKIIDVKTNQLICDKNVRF
ncbi:type IV pilin [Methanosarcina sp.]|uniref:type IV pilin n=1 Tax=Methanosarcina sp. TaxID=2213 RepID=UPI003C76B7C6